VKIALFQVDCNLNYLWE